MIETRNIQKPVENWSLWLIKIITGLAIVILLLVHLLVNHLFAQEGLLSHADVVEYYTSPWIILMEAVFLIVVVSHSLIGLRSILLDLKPSPGVLRILDWVFTIGGAIAVVYGLWLLQAVARFNVTA